MSTLHVTNGDCAAGTLRTFLTDPVRITCDVLHDGPAPRVDGDAWYDVRARFLTDGFGARYDDTRAGLAAFDAELTSSHHDEIVLWFEHDLFDQLLLIRTLDLLGSSESAARRRSPPDRTPPISLICIGEFPGIDRFIGLGQLDAEQLSSLFPRRQRVTGAHYAVAHDAWTAFRADDPRELRDLIVRLNAQMPPAPLPFLADALRRFLEEYPSATNGLSRSAHAALAGLADGPREALTLFWSTQQHEPRPFLGDSGFFDIVRQLASGRTPLVTIAPGADGLDLRGESLTLTTAGRDVLEGRADAVVLGGIDTWRGGVHLVGEDRSPWRWDGARETLVS